MKNTKEYDSTVKRLTEHKISTLNINNIEVYPIDERDSDGAHHWYCIDVLKLSEQEKCEGLFEVPYTVNLKFQKGGLQEAGPNGITDQALIAIVLDRMRGFQNGPYSSRDNAIAITKLEEALDRMARRYRERALRGVEGQTCQVNTGEHYE